MSNTYQIRRTCWNCGTDITLAIPKGILVDDFLDENMCFNCGCHVQLRDTKTKRGKK